MNLQRAFRHLMDFHDGHWHQYELSYADSFMDLGLRSRSMPCKALRHEMDYTVESIQHLEGRILEREREPVRAFLEGMKEILVEAKGLVHELGRAASPPHVDGAIKLESAVGSMTMFRSLLYEPPPDECSEWIWAKPHTDFGLLTIIYQGNFSGLEILENGEWKPTGADAAKVVVLVGELLADWCRDAGFPVAKHRVRGSGKRRSRRAVVVFLYPNPTDVLPLSAIPESWRESANTCSLTAGDYFRRRILEALS